MHFALRLLAEYKNLVLLNMNEILPALLQSLVDSPFYMDVKLSMIIEFLDKIQFHHVDILVDNLKTLIKNSHTMEGILVCNTNPFMVASNILFICHRLKEIFPIVKLRVI